MASLLCKASGKRRPCRTGAYNNKVNRFHRLNPVLDRDLVTANLIATENLEVALDFTFGARRFSQIIRYFYGRASVGAGDFTNQRKRIEQVIRGR